MSAKASAPSLDLTVPATGDEPEGVRAARAFLDGGAVPAGLSAEVAEALVRAVAARGDAARMEALAASSDKALSKQARRGIHLLRTRGVAAVVPATQGAEAVTGPDEPAVPSLVSRCLQSGETFVWFVQARDPLGRLEVAQARIGELTGIEEFDGGRTSRRQWRDMTRSLESDASLSVAHVPGRYARWRIEEAYRAMIDGGRPVPREFAEARVTLGPVEEPARHPAYDEIPEDAVARAAESPVDRVLDLPETLGWIPDETIARRVFDEITAILESPLVLDDKMRDERIADAVRKGTAEALEGPFRARLARRLRDTAYFITQLAHEGRANRDYAGDAALCLAAAYAVEASTIAPEENRVMHALFARLAPAKAPKPEPETQGGGLLITP